MTSTLGIRSWWQGNHHTPERNMSRKLRPLAALATVALIGAGGSYSFAANGNTGSKGSSSAPGTLPSKGSSR
jgi:hypothetical protein